MPCALFSTSHTDQSGFQVLGKQCLDDFYEIGAMNVTNVARRPKIEKNLYEVEIVVVNKERRSAKTDKNLFRRLQRTV